MKEHTHMKIKVSAYETYSAIKHLNCLFSILHTPHRNKRKSSASIRKVIAHNLHSSIKQSSHEHKPKLDYHNTPKQKQKILTLSIKQEKDYKN